MTLVLIALWLVGGIIGVGFGAEALYDAGHSVWAWVVCVGGGLVLAFPVGIITTDMTD